MNVNVRRSKSGCHTAVDINTEEMRNKVWDFGIDIIKAWEV